VTELVFILTDFSASAADSLRQDRPRLALLETCLSRADRSELDSGWRGWLAASAAPSELSGLSLAVAVGAAFRRGAITKPESTGYWLATPVHYFAGLDSIHLHPFGLLPLNTDEQQMLAADFARVFSDSPWRLELLGQRELLLAGPPIETCAADPSLFLGNDPSAGLPRGDGAGALRRLGSEIEMWLYEHPVNRSRQSGGELPVTTLWFWGSQPPKLPATFTKLTRAQLFGSDVYAQALWQLQSRQALGLSAALDEINGVPIRLASDTVVLYPCWPHGGMVEGLMRFEQQWLRPSLRALRQRRLSRVRIIAGSNIFSCSMLHGSRFWRRTAAWWEVLV
jgi:hypothetical protein